MSLAAEAPFLHNSFAVQGSLRPVSQPSLSLYLSAAWHGRTATDQAAGGTSRQALFRAPPLVFLPPRCLLPSFSRSLVQLVFLLSSF